jgi:hypothetical protein
MVPAGCIAAFLLIGLMAEEKPAKVRIMEQCKREFGDQGEYEVNKCFVRLGSRYLNELQKERMDAAYERIR